MNALEVFYKIREACKAMEGAAGAESPPPPGWCAPAWDGIMCWGEAPPGQLILAPCPQYFGFSPHTNATRYCTENGSWYIHEQFNSTWTNFSECIRASAAIPIPSFEAEQLYEMWLPRIKFIRYTGYSLSTITLLAALVVFTRFKRLRCSRNTLHLNVFVSFLLKATMFIVKELLLVEGTAMASDIVTDSSGRMYVKEHNSWVCKAYTTFGQYVVITNYMLVLMEGVYFHRLLFSTCPDYSVRRLLIFGWLSPICFVVPWACTKALYHDELCWTTHGNLPYQFIIHIPITIAMLVNFALFVKIVHVLAAKLHAPEGPRYGRLVRGTLVLMPLFGVPYTLSIATWYPASRSPQHELAWIVFDQTFTSIQGASVALLYCLLSADVRAELKRVLCAGRQNTAAMQLVNGQGPVRRSTTMESPQ